jgi:hypothetical protein
MYAPHPTSSGCRATQSQVHVRTCIWRRFTCMYMICICICTCTWIPQNRCRPATASPQHSAGWQGIAQQFWKQWARGTPVDMDVRVLKSRRRVMSHEICPPDTAHCPRQGQTQTWRPTWRLAEHCRAFLETAARRVLRSAVAAALGACLLHKGLHGRA